MLTERLPIRALARSHAAESRISMPGASSFRSIQTSAALSTQTKRSRPVSRRDTIRCASTTSNSQNSPNSPPLKADPSASSLTWDQFLQLRKVRRRYNLVASGLTGVGSAMSGAGYLSTMDLSQVGKMLFGMDELTALGISTVGCGALGWLLGPFAGNAIFNLLHRNVKNDIMVKEKDFFHRIRCNRADISAGGNLQNNPFPDYYGEKIDSVKGYRQWLRDQKKFSKKRQYQGV